MNTLKHFVLWLDEPIEEVTNKKILQYIDHLLDRGQNTSGMMRSPSSLKG
jgi:hypothetical protein